MSRNELTLKNKVRTNSNTDNHDGIVSNAFVKLFFNFFLSHAPWIIFRPFKRGASSFAFVTLLSYCTGFNL